MNVEEAHARLKYLHAEIFRLKIEESQIGHQLYDFCLEKAKAKRTETEWPAPHEYENGICKICSHREVKQTEIIREPMYD